MNPWFHHDAEWRNGKLEIEAVCHPAWKNADAQDRLAIRPMNSRPGPSGRRSAARPPWLTTPLRIPSIPVISAVRLGRHGTSEEYTLVKCTPSAARASIVGVVSRW